MFEFCSSWIIVTLTLIFLNYCIEILSMNICFQEDEGGFSFRILPTFAPLKGLSILTKHS